MIGQIAAGVVVALGVFMPQPVVGEKFFALTQDPYPVPGYLGPIAIGNRTLRAPTDPDGSDPYLGEESHWPQNYRRVFAYQHHRPALSVGQ